MSLYGAAAAPILAHNHLVLHTTLYAGEFRFDTRDRSADARIEAEAPLALQVDGKELAPTRALEEAVESACVRVVVPATWWNPNLDSTIASSHGGAERANARRAGVGPESVVRGPARRHVR